MNNNSERSGPAGTTGAEDLAVILSQFGSKPSLGERTSPRLITWNSPAFGRCQGTVDLMSDDGWLAVTLINGDRLIWVQAALVTDHGTGVIER